MVVQQSSNSFRQTRSTVVISVMEVETSLPVYSPELAVQSVPPLFLSYLQCDCLKETADYSIPYDASENLASALRRVTATVTTKLYADKTHTD
ncbi:unnamed protein product [Calypogeia fissa]